MNNEKRASGLQAHHVRRWRGVTATVFAAGLAGLLLLAAGWADHGPVSGTTPATKPPRALTVTGKVVAWQVHKDGRVLFALRQSGTQEAMGARKAGETTWVRTNPDLTTVTHVEELVLDTVREVARTQVSISARVDDGGEDGSSPERARAMRTLSWTKAGTR